MISCAEAARIMSDRMNRPVGSRAHIALRIHLLLCFGCRRYGKQLELIRRWLRSDRPHKPKITRPQEERLSVQARARIQAVLQDRASHP